MRFDDARVQAILKGRRIIGRSSFPGDDSVEIGVRLLTESMIDEARFDAQMYLEGKAKRLRMDMIAFVQIDPESLDREHQRQVIYHAIVDPDSSPDKPKLFFENIAQVRSLDSVLTQQLWEIYTDWQDVVNPRLTMSEEEVAALVEGLKDEQIANLILATYERDTLQRLVRFLASQRSK